MAKWKNALHAKYRLKNCALTAASATTAVHGKKKKQKTRKKKKKNPADAVKENSNPRVIIKKNYSLLLQAAAFSSLEITLLALSALAHVIPFLIF